MRARLRRVLRRRARRGGFTLLETLVAFAILTATLGALLQGVGGGARNEARADFLLRATREARSQIAALGVADPILAGETSGRYPDGLEWSLSVAPLDAAKAPTGGAAATTYGVRLRVRRPGSGADALTFSTIKIAVDQEPRQ